MTFDKCVLLFNHYLTQDIKNFIITEHIFCLFVQLILKKPEAITILISVSVDSFYMF